MYKGKFASELSISEVKEYYDELRENGPCTDEQWADFNILKERLIVFAYKLLDGKTNGDVIKALFPHIEAKPYGLITSVKGLDCDKGALDPYRQFWTEWWNAPYKAGKEE